MFINELPEATSLIDTDIFHLKTLLGIDKKITRANLANLLQPILKVDGAVDTTYAIVSTASYTSYYFDVQENQKLPVSIDAPSTVPGKEIEIVYDSSNYGTLPITSTGANIRLEDGTLFTTLCLFSEGERVLKLRSDGTYWNVVNNWKRSFSSGLINSSDATNRHMGTIEIILNDSTGFEVWDIVEESISSFRAIIAGINGNSLYVWFTDDGSLGTGGFFTSGRTLSEISGDASASDTISANTKNVDSDIFNGFNINIEKIEPDLFYSEDGTRTGTASIPYQSLLGWYDNSNIRWFKMLAVDNNNIKCQTGTNGSYFAQDAGTAGVWTTQDKHYELTCSIK